MTKRKWTNMSEYGEEIQGLRDAGMTRQEIADRLGLEKEQIKNWIARQNQARARLARGKIPKRKGRPRTRPLTTEEECRKEIARLEMENKLLRDFLSLTERM